LWTEKLITISTMKNNIQLSEQKLFNELSTLIEQSKNFVIVQANSVMTLLFWNVGKRINEDILQNKRADYGKRIVPTLSAQLTEKYGKNFEAKNLRRMMQFAELFPEPEIVATLSRQLSWSHFKELIPIKDEKSRLFYAKEASERYLGIRELRQSIDLQEVRTAQKWTVHYKKLISIKLIHTIIWLIFASAIMYVCYAGAFNKVNRLVWFCIGAVLFEGIVLLINKSKCPLTPIASKYTNNRSANFDIFLPEWFAKYNKILFTSIFLVGLCLVLWRFI